MSNNAASNVIPMRDFDRPAANPQEAQFDRLLKECQGIALERLSGSLSAMLDKIEDALWGLADQTHDRTVRDLYIAAKDKALAQRTYIEEQYRANYLAEFDGRTRRDRKPPDDFSHFELGSLELGLVTDDDLQETLKVNEMSDKLRRYCEEELNALDQRVGVLIGDANLQGEANPFSPQAVCSAYKQTCRQIESNLKIRMIFHKLFDDYVLDDIRSVYKDLNGLLIQRAILPTIRYGVRRTSGGIGPRLNTSDVASPGAEMPGAVGSPIAGVGMPGGVVGVGGPGVGIPGFGMPGRGMTGVGAPGGVTMGAGHPTEPGGGGEQDFFAVLQGLIAMNAQTTQFAGGVVPGVGMGSDGAAGAVPGRGPAAAGGMIQVAGFPPIMVGPAGIGGIPAAGVAVPTGGLQAGGLAIPHRLLQGAELIGSLTRVQQGDMRAFSGGPSTLDASAFASGTTNVVRELKSTSIGTSVDPTDGMTMDIVAMLFDQIFGDKRVPYALKALIGRLQIPVVKVALLDKKFFSKKSHPARRMLDTLGEFALGLDESFDQHSTVYKKIEAIVQRLIEGFEDDIGIFATLQDDLLVVVREETKRAEDTAKEAARKIAYMERLEVGKAMAQFEIKRRAESTRMPQLVLKLLVDEWLKLLLLMHARHGKESSAWKSALETMDLLIWSVNRKRSVEERRKLATMLPGLLKRLHAGLQAVGTKNETRNQFFAKLMRVHTKVISGGTSEAVTRPAEPEQQPAAVPTLTDAVVPARNADDPPVQNESAASEVQHHAVLSDLLPPPLPTLDFIEPAGSEHKPKEPPAAEHKLSAQSMDAMPARGPVGPSRAPDIDDDEVAAAAPMFSNVTVKNPFGDGEIEVEEISLSDLPGVPNLSGAAGAGSSESKPTDQYSRSVTNLKEGDWLEFRDDDDRRTQAKLAYISPLKGTYLFVNRPGVKVGEYSAYHLMREFRAGRAALLETVPLFDRAMSSLVGVLKKNS